jgi:hypothetical protein
MKNVYVVCWASASQDDDGNSKAFSGVYNIYNYADKAKNGLESCKNEFLDDLVNNPDLDEEDREELKASIHTYGSVNDDFFEIDYISGDISCELYIHIVEKELIG